MVPTEYQAEAWIDSPIRVEEHDYNISAPHMHAQMLESLDISPGDRVLDVGTGCGFIAGAAAVLAGKTGTVVGIDIKDTCISLCRANIAELTTNSSEFASTAAPITFYKHNVFIPSALLRGKFNKVCVGATVPTDKMHLLLPLLEPEGGKLLAPVEHDLRLYTRTADGKLRQRQVSSVRFSDLEVPSDASIALSVLEDEQLALMRVAVSRPSLIQDLQQDMMHKGCGGGGFIHLWSSCFNSLSSGFNSPGSSPSGGSDQLIDCELVGAAGWRLAAHKVVLRGAALVVIVGLIQDLPGRVAHFRAKLSSSMRDAEDCVHQVPESFSRFVMEGLLHYCYRDELPAGLEPADVVKLLQAAAYYGTPRLIELCEERLVSELLQLAPVAAAAEAPHLLCLADELGLIQLRTAATAFIAQHYNKVQACEAWGCLDRTQVELVASHLAAQITRLKQLLGELQPPTGSAALPKRRSWW
eukprot:gene3599-3864_t